MHVAARAGVLFIHHGHRGGGQVVLLHAFGSFPSLSDFGTGCKAGLDCAQVGRQAGDAIDVTVPETSGPGQPLRVPQGFFHKLSDT